MPQQGVIYRALIASPNDCAEERKIIPEVVAAWNAVHSVETAAIVEAVLWERHSRPEFGDRPQGIINRQLVDRCDLLIGAFWTRLGTPTGVAESGTAEEIEQFRAAGKPVLLYFSKAPVALEHVDNSQWQALVEYRKRLTDGLYHAYESVSKFRDDLQRHFAGTMIELIRKHPVKGAEVLELRPEQDRGRRLAVEFESFVRRLTAEWKAERDSRPMSTGEGKLILGRAADNLLQLTTMVTSEMPSLPDAVDEALKRMRALQRHQCRPDGGRSFKHFWDEGDSILQLLTNTRQTLLKVDESLLT